MVKQNQNSFRTEKYAQIYQRCGISRRENRQIVVLLALHTILQSRRVDLKTITSNACKKMFII